MKVMIITDAWFPQINGVVRTLTETGNQLRQFGHEVEYITPQDFRTIPCPTYPEIRLSLFPYRRVARKLRRFAPDALHIATEGPLGLAGRAYAIRHQLAFTTAYHTRFPEYIHSRIRLPLAITYCFMRWFHGASEHVMVPTRTVFEDLTHWRIGNPVIWPRGVDLEIFSPDPERKPNPKPVFLYVGRVSVEKNLAAFLGLELDGEKWVVGDGPAMAEMKSRFPDTIFHGAKPMEELPAYYNHADVFVFPSATDTFGLVLLEAMGCGLPVAALPVTGPLDVIGDSAAGVLDHDLKHAAEQALGIPRCSARAHAERFSWPAATRLFENNLVNIRDRDHTYHIDDNPYKGNTGLRRAARAAVHSWSGIIYALREESAFRQEILLAALCIIIALAVPVSLVEKLLMIGSVFLVLIIELINSGVEAAIDRISFDRHGLSKRAKDYGSAAVMLALILCGGIHLAIICNWLIQH